MNPISPARDGCFFFPPALSLPLLPSRLSATLNNSLTVRADLAHRLTDKYLKRKAVRWEQSALFTSQANTPLVCDGSTGWGFGVGGWTELLEPPVQYQCTHLLCLPDTGEDTRSISDPPAHSGNANVTSACLWSCRWDFAALCHFKPHPTVGVC